MSYACRFFPVTWLQIARESCMTSSRLAAYPLASLPSRRQSEPSPKPSYGDARRAQRQGREPWMRKFAHASSLSATHCASAEDLLPGNFIDRNGTLSWQPARCMRWPLAQTGSYRYSDEICAALTAGADSTRRLLFVGDSTVRNLFVVIISYVLAPSTENAHERTTAMEVSRCRGDRRFDSALDQAQHLPPNCSFAVRCNGALELRLWMPPEPFAPNGQRVPLRTHLEAKLASSSGKWDGAIASIGTHYYAGYNRNIPHVNVTRAYAEDVSGLVAGLASASVSTLAYFTNLRPVVEKKPPRWRAQSECVAADANTVALNALDRPLHASNLTVTVLDGFEWIRGMAAHSTDGTHYDVPILAEQGSLLVETLAVARLRPRAEDSKVSSPRSAHLSTSPPSSAPCVLHVPRSPTTRTGDVPSVRAQGSVYLPPRPTRSPPFGGSG